MKKTILAGILSVSCLAAFSGSASAATLTLDFNVSGGSNVNLGGDFVADELRIVNGNCDSASSAPCAALNVIDETTITRSSGLSFTLTSYWYQLLGSKAEMDVEFLDEFGGTLATDTFDAPVDGNNDGGHVIAGPAFEIWGVRFSDPGNNPGDVRIDDLIVNVAAVPVPAGGMLLLTGLGGMALMRRRKKA